MAFPTHLLSPNGVKVAIGSKAEEMNLRGRGYRDVPAEPEQTAEPEQVAEAEHADQPADAAAAVEAAQAESAAAQKKLQVARKDASGALSAVKAELPKSDK